MRELAGAMPAMVTPFDERGELNLGALPSYVDFQRRAGMDGVVVCGTNGEGVSMTVSERKRLLESVIALREEFLIIAGTGAANFPDAMELTKHAADVGADGALVLPPFFYKNPSAAGIADYFRRILDIAAIPILLYSIPQQTAVPITDDILELLKEHPRLAGMKDSQGNWDRTSALIRERPNLRIFAGNDELLSRSLSAGGAGVISGTANAFPELVVAVRDGVRNGDGSAAQARLDAAKNIIIQYPLIAAAKSVLANRGVDRMWVRPPLIQLTAGQESEMMGKFREAGLLS